jgi:TatD DNase family protein
VIDTHVHLDAFPDPPSVLERAAGAGVSGVVAVGVDLASNRIVLDLAARFPDRVLPAVGYHPWHIREGEADATLAHVRSRAGGCVAVGEIGLDYRVKVPKPLQREVLGRQLRMAAELGKPVIVHNRYSHGRALRMVVEAGVERAVFHWYSGPLDVLGGILAEGHFVSATPAAATSPAHRAALAEAPLDRILVETDAPSPMGQRPTEPADLLLTIGALARLKGLDAETVAAVTGRAAETFFFGREPATEQGGHDGRNQEHTRPGDGAHPPSHPFAG